MNHFKIWYHFVLSIFLFDNSCFSSWRFWRYIYSGYNKTIVKCVLHLCVELNFNVSHYLVSSSYFIKNYFQTSSDVLKNLISYYNSTRLVKDRKDKLIIVMASILPTVPPKTPSEPITIAIVGAGDRQVWLRISKILHLYQ